MKPPTPKILVRYLLLPIPTHQLQQLLILTPLPLLLLVEPPLLLPLLLLTHRIIISGQYYLTVLTVLLLLCVILLYSEEEEDVLSTLVDAMGQLLKLHGPALMPFFDEVVAPKFAPFLDSSQPQALQVIATPHFIITCHRCTIHIHQICTRVLCFLSIVSSCLLSHWLTY